MKCVTFWMLLSATAAAAQEPPVTHYDALSQASTVGQAPETALAGLLKDSDDRMTVAVRLSGSRPYRFIVDTGSDRTSVSIELAKELGLSELPGGILHSASGSSEVRMAWLPELSVSQRSVHDINAPILAALDIGADGILGIDSLRSQRVIFDFVQRTLSIVSAATPVDMDSEAIVVTAKRREGRLIVTDAQLDGQKVSVVLDTGSAMTIGNSVLRRRLERTGRLNLIGQVDLISVTGRSLRGELASVKGLAIGGTHLEGVQMAFVEAHTFGELHLDRKPAILLGMNALKGFDQVSIDFADRTVSLVVPKRRRSVRT